MPRRTADERHRLDAGTTHDLIDVLIALHHPTRRWLFELLRVEGPASVGRLAARTGLAVGSISHHLKPLHQQGFVEPAPDLARDTRESWWRGVPRNITWSIDDFEPASAGRLVAHQAEIENLRHQVRAIEQWIKEKPDAPIEWRRAANSTDAFVNATVDQLADLHHRLGAVLSTWADECRDDQEEHPDVERRPVRAQIWSFPSRPVRP